MTQFAIVKKQAPSGKAEVEVLRGTACGDDCGSCEVCNYASKLRIEARNPLCAEIGDRVEIETQSSRILGAAFMVYVVPFILFFIGYAVASALKMSEGSSILMSFGFFAVGMAATVLLHHLRRKNPITYEITKIIEHGESL
ncbi:MAG: SoxR reducing system RseC family protein [Oscillospiraceae bacterium]